MFKANYADVFKGDSRWNRIASPDGAAYRWDGASTYIKNPPYFDGMSMQVGKIADVAGARAMGIFGDSITTDHISPAGNDQEGFAGRAASCRNAASSRWTSTATARAAATTT